MDDDNVAIRLKGFIESEGLTNSQFADRAGIPRPSLSQLLTGRNKKISDVIVGQIHKAFPDLSVVWLMFGEGEMLLSSANKVVTDDDGDSVFADMENFIDNDTDSLNNSTLSGLNRPLKQPSNRVNTEIEEDLRIVELQRQIDKMKRNPRKVSHITVYYDDSTFETFYPRR